MTAPDAITAALAEWPAFAQGEDGQIIVPTHCLYPSNAVVSVHVVGAVGGAFLVTDGWGAYEEACSAGSRFEPEGVASIARYAVGQYGVAIDKTGLIKAERVRADELMATITLVANGSKDAANAVISRFRPRLRRNLKAELTQLLELFFPNRHVKEPLVVVGASNKPHKFDVAVRLPGDRRLLLSAVAHEASSINSVLVSHLDVRNAKSADYEQRIVYDDEDRWNAADLNLLRIGAQPVPFSQAQSVIERLAA